MKKFHTFLIAILVTVLVGISFPGYGDDISLYRGQVDLEDENNRPNILFVLDRSGSMGLHDFDIEGNDVGGTRMERMQEALLKYLDNMHNVNVGFMVFSGQPPYDSPAPDEPDSAVVPVLFPITYIDESARNIFGDSDTAFIQTASRILSSADDAEEGLTSHNVTTNSLVLEAVHSTGTDMRPGKTVESRITAEADDALEILVAGRRQVVGTVYATTKDQLYLGGSTWGETLVGLRFPAVAVPQGKTIKNAQIVFSGKEYNNSNAIKSLDVLIQAVDLDNPGSFQESSRYISDNFPPKIDTSVKWEIGENWLTGESYTTPSLTEMVQGMVDRTGWASGNAMAFRLVRDPDTSTEGYREFYTAKTKSYPYQSPLLRITYEDDNGINVAGNFEEANTVKQQISSDGNDAYEFRGDGAGSRAMTAGTVVTDKSMTLGNSEKSTDTKYRGKTLVGLRFSNLDIPKNATITHARIDFIRSKDFGKANDDAVSVNIYAQNADNASAFSGGTWEGTITDDLSTRYKTTAPVSWAIPVLAKNELLSTPDISSLVQTIVNRGSWTQNDNALVLLFEHESGTGSRYVYEYSDGSSKAATLSVDWLIPTDEEEQLIGLRFQNVQIPRGATVTKAFIDFNSGADKSGSAKLRISGEAHDDSLAFTSVQKNISNRALTSAFVNWNNAGAWTTNEVYSSQDLIPIVQEIVNRPGWCGANSMSFIISENGHKSLRHIRAYDDFPDKAPVLLVEYDLDTVPENTCIKETYSKQISHRDDDSEQMSLQVGVASTEVLNKSRTLEMTTTVSRDGQATKRVIGFRFTKIPIKRGTTILKAELVFTAQKSDNSLKDKTGAELALKIRGEYSPTAEKFEEESANLSSRPLTSAVDWKPDTQNAPLTPWIAGLKYATPDLSSIVQKIVNQAGWQVFNDMAFFISGSGLRSAAAYDQDPSKAAILRIQMEGSQEAMTVRFRIKDVINEMTISDYTPLTDAIYEAGQYYMGEEVTHGRDRRQQTRGCLNKDPDTKRCLDLDRECIKYNSSGNCTAWNPSVNNIKQMKKNRVSHSGSWDQDTGVLIRNTGCSAIDLNADACVTERIMGNNPKYIKPKSAMCQSNFIVFLTDGQATTNASQALIKALPDIELVNGDCQAKTIDNSRDYSKKEKCGIDMVRYLYESDLDSNLPGQQNIITYTIGFALGDTYSWIKESQYRENNHQKILDGQGNWITNSDNNRFLVLDSRKTTENEKAVQYLRDWAEVGGGAFFEANSAQDLQNAFTQILSQVVINSASFAAPSLSINAFNQLYHNNDLYISLFEPGHKASWLGNIKKYSLCDGPSCGTCIDESGNSRDCEVGDIMDGDIPPKLAIDSDSKVSTSAIGRWTSLITRHPDGAKVQEGGAGAKLLQQMVQDPASRNIYTNATGDDVLTKVKTNNSKLTPSVLGVSTAVERNAVINWIRGYRDGLPAAGIRKWLLFDSLHNSPVAITTGGMSDNYIAKVFVATNGGEIRALNAETGAEEWVFIPKEMLLIQKTLMDNPAGNIDHTYGIDGNFSLLIKDNNSDDDSIDSIKLFIGMRRGGRNIYALDVTPDSSGHYSANYKPELMWTIRGGEFPYGSLGQTWSTPQPTNVSFAGTNKTVLLFGGGYEAYTQDNSQITSTVTYSNAIYMVDPDDGTLLWWVSNVGSGADLELTGMNYSIPSKLALIDSTGDDLTNRIYVGDTGGNVWRIDLASDISIDNRGGSVGGRLASLGTDSSSAQVDKRRFFYAPDVVMLSDPKYSAQPDYDMVLISSGYRPEPLGTYIQDRFYALRDRVTGMLSDSGDGNAQMDASTDESPIHNFFTLSHKDLFNATNNILQEGSAEQIKVAEERLKDKYGWYIDLEESGEKGLSSPVVLDGTAFFTTFVPVESTNEDRGQGQGSQDKITICHIPPGNPSNAHTIVVDKHDLAGYLAKGDIRGPCACSTPQGEGRIYALNILNGGAASNYDKSNDLSDDDEVKEKTDRKDNLGEGIPSQVLPVFQKKGISLVVGSGGGIHKVDKLYDLPKSRVFWLQK